MVPRLRHDGYLALVILILHSIALSYDCTQIMSAKAVRARSSSYILVGVLVLALVVGTSAQCNRNPFPFPTCLLILVVVNSHQVNPLAELGWAPLRLLEGAATVKPLELDHCAQILAISPVKMAALVHLTGSGALAPVIGRAMHVTLVSTCLSCFLTL